MKVLLVVWLFAAVATCAFYLRSGRPKCGILLSYVIVLFVNYWLGALVYVLPSFIPVRDPELTRLGFQASVYGITAFGIGAMLVAPVFFGGRNAVLPVALPPRSGDISRYCMIIGVVSYVALSTVLASVPSATSLAAVGQQLFVVGICLLAARALRERQWRHLILLLGLASALPFITMLAHGFLIYGTVSMFAIMAFVSVLLRRRAPVLVGALLVGILSLSLYVTYLRDRVDIREVVWGGSSTPVRLGQLHRTLTNFELFSLNNARHLKAIDDRLNLSYLTGAAIRQTSVTHHYANGSTLVQAMLSAVPRVLLPNKQAAGGSAMVTRYTGLEFYGSTSVGMGQVMELYVNGGTLAVLVGFGSIGVILRIIDDSAARRLAAGDETGFALLFVVGLAFLQVGGSFAEVVSTAAATVVLMVTLNRYLDSHARRARPGRDRNLALPGPPRSV